MLLANFNKYMKLVMALLVSVWFRHPVLLIVDIC